MKLMRRVVLRDLEEDCLSTAPCLASPLLKAYDQFFYRRHYGAKYRVRLSSFWGIVSCRRNIALLRSTEKCYAYKETVHTQHSNIALRSTCLLNAAGQAFKVKVRVHDSWF